MDLGATGIIGIVGAGDKSKAFDVARTMIAQIAANNSYRDVKLAFAFDSETDSSEWMNYRFMPHVWLDDYSERLMASDRSSVDDLFFRIIDILRDREQKDYTIEKRQFTHIVLFVADTSLLEGHAINKYITTDAQKYSFTVVTLADKESQLLNDTTYELIIDKQFSGIHRMMGRLAVYPTALHFLICWEYKGWKNCGFSTDGRQTKITTVCGLS